MLQHSTFETWQPYRLHCMMTWLVVPCSTAFNTMIDLPWQLQDHSLPIIARPNQPIQSSAPLDTIQSRRACNLFSQHPCSMGHEWGNLNNAPAYFNHSLKSFNSPHFFPLPECVWDCVNQGLRTEKKGADQLKGNSDPWERAGRQRSIDRLHSSHSNYVNTNQLDLPTNPSLPSHDLLNPKQ